MFIRFFFVLLVFFIVWPLIIYPLAVILGLASAAKDREKDRRNTR